MSLWPYFGLRVPGLVQQTVGGNPGTNFKKQELQSDALRANGNYGLGIVLRGNELFVGEPGALGSIFVVGEVHYYTRPDPNTNFTRDQGFHANTQQNGQKFGLSLGYDGTTLLVGSPNPSPGDAWVYTDVGGTWTFDEQILPNTTTSTASNFGQDLSIVGNHALIGAPGYAAGGSARGGVEYWENVAGTWTFRQALTSSVTTNSQKFGSGVAMADDSTAYILRYGTTTGLDLPGTSTVEKWTRTGTTWTFDSQWSLSWGQSSAADHTPMDCDGTNLCFGFFDHDADVNNEGLVVITNQSGSILAEIDGTTLETEFGSGASIDGSEGAFGEHVADPSSTTNAGIAEIWQLDGI